MTELRRSQRHLATLYDANGREYLAGELNLTRAELKNWLVSPTVHPHLLSWYKICISSKRRYNEALQWLEGGEKSYFYTPQAIQLFNGGTMLSPYDKEDLEEDLLLMCLGEGNIGDVGCGDESEFAMENLDTRNMPAQTLWARTAWRIVQGNRGDGQVFEKAAIYHPAAAYALAIDILCIAFHSIACRGSYSIWSELVHNGAALPASNRSNEVVLDQIGEEGSEDVAFRVEGENESYTSSEASFVGDKDEDYELPETPKRSKNVSRVPTPSAPRKAKRADSPRALTHDWLASLPDSNSDFEDAGVENDPSSGMLMMVDDTNGVPIAEYRMAH